MQDYKIVRKSNFDKELFKEESVKIAPNKDLLFTDKDYAEKTCEVLNKHLSGPNSEYIYVTEPAEYELRDGSKDLL